jgi:two-component system nitrogen regulation response regulator GlnG
VTIDLLGDDASVVEVSLPCLTILSHPDVDRVGERALLREVTQEAESVLARHELEFSPPRGGAARPLDDPYISRRPIRFTAARFGGIRLESRDSGTRLVANGDWIPTDRVFLGVEVKRGVVLALAQRITLLLHNLATPSIPDGPTFGMVGENTAITAARQRIQEAAQETTPILIRGERGVGKKLVAAQIQGQGERRDGPQVTVNLADEAPTVADLLAKAAGGNLLLLSVEKMASEDQKALLEALEKGADLRLLATTSAKAARRWQKSSEPLLRLLAENSLEIPGLANRRDDIGRLMIHFLREEIEKLGDQNLDPQKCLADPGPHAQPWLSVKVVSHLAGYEWPHNVTQLRNVARQLLAEHAERDEVVHGPALEQLLESTAESPDWDWGSKPAEEENTDLRPASEIGEGELLTALRAHRWQARPTAAQLKISEEDLFGMIEKLSESTRRRRRRRRPPPPSATP